jgi:ABC-type transport system substrate-binding protein
VSARGTGAASGLPVLRWFGLVGTATWAQTLDPALVTDTISAGILSMTDAGLVTFRPSGKVVPDLATWKVSKNHKVYTFTIRPNARFANGDPVTAEDAAYSISRALAKTTNSPTSLQNFSHIVGATKWNKGKAKRLQGVRVLNRRQLQVFLDAPIAFFLGALANTSNMLVLDKRIVAGHPAQTYLTNTCSAQQGAGPFTFQCRNTGTGLSSFYASGTTPQITLVPNKYYYGRKPHIVVNMRAIADTQTNYRDYQANGIDTASIPTADIARERGKPDYRQWQTLEVWYLSPDPKVPPFTNVHCRRAVAFAVDEATITDKILHGSEFAIHSVVPKGVLGYYTARDVPTYNPAQARAELRQCPGGIHNVKIAYQHTSSDWDNVYGSALPAMFQSVGIDIKAKPLTFNGWLQVVTQPQSKTGTAIAQNGLTAFSDPWNYATILLRGGEPFNSGEYNNLAYNRLVDKADITANPEDRARLYRQAQRIALNDGGYIPMGQQRGFGLIKPWVHGLIGNALFADGLGPANNDWSRVSVSKH